MLAVRCSVFLEKTRVQKFIYQFTSEIVLYSLFAIILRGAVHRVLIEECERLFVGRVEGFVIRNKSNKMS